MTQGALRCIVVDDEPLGRDVLVNYIRRIPQLVLAGSCGNAKEAFALLHLEKADLMFLDIKMPGISGLDFVRSLKNPPGIIFTTAFSQFAVTGFELDAIDYLLKPFTFERFKKSIDKVLKVKNSDAPETRNFTYFKISGSLVKIFHEDFRFAQSEKDYIMLHTTAGKHMTHMTMKYLNELLPKDAFIRIHRSFIINKKFVTAVGREHLMLEKDKIPIGEHFRGNVELVIDKGVSGR